jgi:type III secretion protein C
VTVKRGYLATALLFLFLATASMAAPINWPSGTYSHFSQGESLAGMLRNFCASQGINVIISEKVTGTQSGRFINVPPGILLNQIAIAYGLIWYYDGTSLYIYRSDESASKMIDLDGVPIERFRSILDRLGITDDRFPIKNLEGENIIYVSGPARYIELITETAEVLLASAQKEVLSRQVDEVVRVFPLKYAWAQDLTFNFMRETVVVPGVASILINILSGKPAPGLIAGSNRTQLPVTVEKLKGQGLVAIGRESPPNGEAAPPANGDQNNAAETNGGVQASIQADPRLNAVIVRDSVHKMPYYEETIKLLDVPVGLVQIQAAIVDIGTDSLRDLGVAWRFRSDRLDNGIVVGGFEAGEETLGDGDNVRRGAGLEELSIGEGLNLATIIGDSATYLLGQIRALEEQGKARILSEPRVLTLDNVEAHLEHAQTVHVRVEGDEEVDLFDVTTGVVLRVTPHVIDGEEGAKIKLAVNVEDGGFLDVTVDEIPVVQKTTINTQAVIKEDESLLIGGYYREVKSEVVRQVPCLGSIPLMGGLFKRNTTEKEQMQRIFLITPNLITHDAYPEPVTDLPAGDALKQPIY